MADLDTNIGETERFVLPSGQVVEAERWGSGGGGGRSGNCNVYMFMMTLLS